MFSRAGVPDLRTITRRDVIELLDAIVDEGKPVAAYRTLAAMRKLFNWALQRGIIEATPIALVEMPGAERRRERTLAPDEIRAVWPRLMSSVTPLAYSLR